MMERVALGPLHDVPEPPWRSDIGMLENRKEVRHQDHDRNGLRREACDKAEANAAQRYPTQHIKGAEIKRSVRIEPFRAMMHLVEALPKKVTPVKAVMPDKDAEFV